MLQAVNKNVAKVPPPVPTKPKQIHLPYFGQTAQSPSDMKPDGNAQQLPIAATSVGAKLKPAGPQARMLLSPGAPSGGQDQVLSPASKQESPPAAAVRPFTPQPSKDTFPPAFRKPQTVAASSIYSMYTQQQAPGKNFQQAVQSALTKTQPRGPHFSSGKVPLFVFLRGLCHCPCSLQVRGQLVEVRSLLPWGAPRIGLRLCETCMVSTFIYDRLTQPLI